MIKPRYAKGSGQAPAHLASINAADSQTGDLVFAGAVAGQRHVSFASHAELLAILNALILERVPFAVGGMCPGPADEVGLLIANKELAGPYLELSWTGPQQWLVRQIGYASSEWQQVPDACEIANISFSEETLIRNILARHSGTDTR
ncbi:hypothetical protein [Pseudomonas baetica]|uniref:hypothetical protein n=1 Tax=Pseudomonas baetica TaxID=674054 RepID=UPI002892B212|nr:hypothetical protein [Pseudomonas baetica]